MPVTARCIQQANATVGEGPLWDGQRQALWWLDIRQNRILLHRPGHGQVGQWWLPTQVFSVSLTQDGRLLVALETGLYFFDTGTGALEQLGTLVHGPGTTRFNDGKIDPAGRLWIGTVDLTTFRPCGSLYVVEPNGTYQTRLSGIRCSNGLGWTADGRTMFYTDSRAMLIWAFDFDAETSSLARQRVHARIEDRNASPDGLSVDMDGCVWSALFGGSAVIQFDPAGQEVRRVQVPALRPTSCAFGGEDMRTLFITTESFQLDPAALRGGPLSGGLFAWDSESQGVPVHKFSRL